MDIKLSSLTLKSKYKIAMKLEDTVLVHHIQRVVDDIMCKTKFDKWYLPLEGSAVKRFGNGLLILNCIELTGSNDIHVEFSKFPYSNAVKNRGEFNLLKDNFFVFIEYLVNEMFEENVQQYLIHQKEMLERNIKKFEYVEDIIASIDNNFFSFVDDDSGDQGYYIPKYNVSVMVDSFESHLERDGVSLPGDNLWFGDVYINPSKIKKEDKGHLEELMKSAQLSKQFLAEEELFKSVLKDIIDSEDAMCHGQLGGKNATKEMLAVIGFIGAISKDRGFYLYKIPEGYIVIDIREDVIYFGDEIESAMECWANNR